MSSITRQSSLLVAEDWKKVYQTFRDADFQSYDFETLRKSMIDYLRLYYPEDFNDFVDSSEYIALIDLIAFLGQALAFRTDLNSRENFLDTAERRDSILKLARLVSYSPKRSNAASGFLKINSVTTTEALTDSNGINLANLVITWNDATNANWLEQFTLALNATFLNSQVIGKSGNSQIINGIRNDEYTINITANTLPAFAFTEIINGINMQFEAVSATSINQPYVYEIPPSPASRFNILYRNDNQGNGSNNTGFFMYFKQGGLQSIDFAVGESLPNRVLNVGFNNINNSDVWLYSLDASNVEKDMWKSVPAVAGVNVIYNKSTDRNLYQINTRTGDQIDLVFGDGSFSNVPQGSYRIYFRTSNGLTYKITPDEMQNVSISMNYISRAGTVETITLRANLNYTVTNASSSESIDDIRQKAPQAYYTQGRMITGEDYNIVPFTQFSNVLKVKAVNRSSSGVSRFLDVNDSSGKYSSTNIFAQDGHLYQEDGAGNMNFTFLTSSNVQQVAQDDLTTILNSKEMTHFYYANFTRYSINHCVWNMSSLSTNGCTGYYFDPTQTDQTRRIWQLGYQTSAQTRYVNVGAIIRFKAIDGYYFNSQNQMVKGVPQYAGDKVHIYSSVMQVIGDGTNGGAGNFANGSGPVTMSQKVPTGAILDQVIPVFKNSLPASLITLVVQKILAYNNFALRYDIVNQEWAIVNEEDINVADPFSLTVDPSGTAPTSAGDKTGNNRDSSWLVKFTYSPNIGYTIDWRGLNYVFESTLETRFYFDEKVKVYDSNTATVIQDEIKVLKVNTAPDSSAPLGIDYTWNIFKNIVDIDGYENQSKILITFTDTNDDGIPDNPDVFEAVVNPTVTPVRKLVFFKQTVDYTSFITYTPIPSSIINVEYTTFIDLFPNRTSYLTGQVFYLIDEPINKFYQLTVTGSVYTLAPTGEYIAKVGREDLYFQYRHNSPGYRRIDPSPNNIIDLFMLTQAYSTDYQNWIRDTTNTLIEPDAPTTDALQLQYNKLENYKAISDTIIFNSARFKPLFGVKAVPALQAIFKVVKNPALNISDNDIKSSVINAINTYFSVDNWDFGESFYFSELSAYLHSALTPNVSSVIIVPLDPAAMFGSLYQINAEANEIITSAATVDNVEIISAITAATINANFAGLNSSATTFGTA